MRRLRAKQNEITLSLFPFLAVLICTMGSLIALLVVAVQDAKVQADEIASRDDADLAAAARIRKEELAELKRQQEDYQWRTEILRTQREELTKQLDQRRLELSHLEEHHRRLKVDLERLLNQSASFESADQLNRDQQAMADELARIRQAIVIAEQEIAAARQQVQAVEQSYALLPYDGPNGTRRRPIYVECTENGVIIQPEGIVLTPRDFSGPLGPGNALDAALRAVREYMATNGLLAADEEPYPLLVVRPGGSISYQAARAAMTSWDNEFGYELIDSDTKLAYGDPDALRAEKVVSAVEEARQRMNLMRASAPTRFKGSELFSFTEKPWEAGGTGAGNFGGHASGGNGSGAVGNGPQAIAVSSGGGQNNSYSGQQSDNSTQAGSRNAQQQSSGASTNPNMYPQRIANSRGANWAIEGADGSSIGYNRPISMTLHENRIEIAASREFPLKTIAFLGPTANGIGTLVTTVQERVKSWGIAGRGTYWKPVLVVDVQPGAERRYDDLRIMLDRSGLELEKK